MDKQGRRFARSLGYESLESREMMAANALSASLARQELRIQFLEADQHIARPVVDQYAIKLTANARGAQVDKTSATSTPTTSTSLTGSADALRAATLATSLQATTLQAAAATATFSPTIIPVASGRSQFVLQGINKDNLKDSVLSKAEGMALRVTWDLLEPTNNKYSWTYLDTQMARADRMGKPVQLILLAGNDAPSWLSGLGVKVVGGIPQPWSSITQAQYKELATAIATHLAQTGTLDRVTHIYTPGAESAEWHYDNISGFYSQTGYSDANMVAGQVGFAKTLADAFPNSIVVATIGDHDQDWTATAIAQLKSELRGQIGFQMNSLSAKTSTSYLGFTRIRDAAAQGYHAGFQTVSASNTSRFGGSYAEANSLFLSTKAQWIQVYAPDVT